MIENTDSLLPKGKTCAYTVGIENLDELHRLLATLGVEVTGFKVAPVREISAGTYFGSGKLQEIKIEAGEDVDLFVFDVELSPKQMQNLEKVLGKPILDRAGVILEIFSRHARTRESKTQVELARLQYVLPRLAGLWAHFERQRGGGVGNKGMGEKQIEVDRRLIKNRIQMLKSRLLQISKERKVQRSSRKNVLKVALAGYTNAGKSTLLNALTQSTVLAEDKLFATLDATVRALSPDTHPPVVAIDTVGFIERIPTTLIASFKSTLEEITDADLILHVVDASASEAQQQFETTQKVLEELGCSEKETLVIFNKMDLIKTPAERNRIRVLSPKAVMVSAYDEDAVKRLREQILNYFKSQMESWDLLVPYEDGKLQSQIQEYGAILNTKYMEKGIFYQVRFDATMAKKLGLKKYALYK